MTSSDPDRDTEIASAIASGATATAVAALHDLTPQRVRQIAAAAGVAPRRAGRPRSTGRGRTAGAVGVHVALSPAERAALVEAAGGEEAVAGYLRDRGLASLGRAEREIGAVIVE